jgi:16S rRNA (guanine527-N7)-methyltransferase
VLESLMILTVVPEPASPLLDIGSGPGVPGLILRLARPSWEVALVEAARRRANFLRHAVRRLNLDGVAVHGERAEALSSGPLAGRFRTVTMRAVAAPEEAVSLARPFLASNGAIVLPVGPQSGTPTTPIRTVTLETTGELPLRRQFLIIHRAELDAGVPRGTG